MPNKNKVPRGHTLNRYASAGPLAYYMIIKILYIPDHPFSKASVSQCPVNEVDAVCSSPGDCLLEFLGQACDIREGLVTSTSGEPTSRYRKVTNCVHETLIYGLKGYTNDWKIKYDEIKYRTQTYCIVLI